MPDRDQQLSAWCFPFCPQPPNWTLDWQAIVDHFAWVRAMEDCPQDPQWHGEGNVLIHTRMVCEALIGLDSWRTLSPEERSVLFAATLMHDIAKPIVTREEQGRLRAPRHAAKGTQMARTLLAQELLVCDSQHALHLREQIVGLVLHHGLPLYFLARDKPEREIITASQTARCDWLALLAQADAMGRHCDDQQELLDRVEYFREFSREQRCYNRPREFASDHTRFLFFQGQELDPDCELFDDRRLTAIVMSGLPAAGKDSWIRSDSRHLPVVSLDAIREELDVPPDDNQGPVIARAKEQAREHLRQGASFIWNATNITAAMRRQLVTFFHQYHARCEVIYVEAPWPELLHRNQHRPNPVPNSVMKTMLDKLEVPNATESHQVTWRVTN